MIDFSQKKVGNYTITKKIGDGGFATVYLAEHAILDKKVAVKFMLEDWVDEADVVTRFFDEARTMERLKEHPNITKIIDIATAEKCAEDGLPPYFIMEYVEGMSLEEIIKSDIEFSIDDIINIIGCALAALQHCHNLGVVHRDIKPSNIMITPNDEIKLTDFGIAKARVNTSKTGEGLTLGSTDYMSPEQALGKRDLDYRSDIYSLGVTLYQMVCDRLPFVGDSPNAVALKHIQEPLIAPVKRNEAIPKRLSDIIVKAMEKNKELRFQSCNEMLEAIKNLDGPEPTVEADVNTIDLSALDTELIDDEFVNEFRSDSPTHSTTRKMSVKPPPGLISAIRIIVIMILAIGMFLGVFKLYNNLITAHLMVETIPAGAYVILNGEQIGTSPIQLPITPMGYKVSLSLQGYATKTAYFDIAARQDINVKHSFVKLISGFSPQQFFDAVVAADSSVPRAKPKTKSAAKKLAAAETKLAKAWKLLFEEIETFKKYPDVHLAFVEFCKDHNWLKHAEEFYIESLKKQPNITLFIFLGIVKKMNGDRKSALNNFMKAWSIDKDDKLLLNTLAEYFIEEKDLPKAKQYLEMSLFLYPKQPEIRNKFMELQ